MRPRAVCPGLLEMARTRGVATKSFVRQYGLDRQLDADRPPTTYAKGDRVEVRNDTSGNARWLPAVVTKANGVYSVRYDDGKTRSNVMHENVRVYRESEKEKRERFAAALKRHKEDAKRHALGITKTGKRSKTVKRMTIRQERAADPSYRSHGRR